jgi:hypothetical protein
LASGAPCLGISPASRDAPPLRQYIRMPRDLQADQRERQRRSVEHLQGLYSVVAAIALSLAADRLLPASDHAARPRAAFALASALLVTLNPFYHGALRHLDELYGQGRGRAAHSFSVLVDFLLLFLESCVFLSLGASVTEPRVFAWLFFALLALDVVWAHLTTTFLVAEAERGAQKTWLKVNLSFGLLLLAILVLFTVQWAPSGALPFVVVALALARTATDYTFSWKFYVAAPG